MKFARLILNLARPLIFIIFPYKVIGAQNVPEQDGKPVILCSNHISFMDPVFLLLSIKRHIHYMAKAELFKGPLASWFFQKQFGAFPVRRGEGDTASLDNAERIVREGKMMGIFPEGTRSKDGRLGRAKSGAALIAARTQASVLPVAVMAPGQKVRPFKKTYIIIGRTISPAELGLNDAQSPDLRFASRLIMQRIAEMMEENR